MKDFWNSLMKVVLRLIQSFSSSSNNETSSLPTTLSQSESSSTEPQQKSELEIAVDAAKKELSGIAIETVTEHGMGLLSKYSSMLSSIDPKQKEYVLNMAILKSADISKMTGKELCELGEVSVKLSELGLEISDELDEFWSKFGEVVSELGEKLQGVATKVISTSLIGVLL